MTFCFFVVPFDVLIMSNEISVFEHAKGGDKLTLNRRDVHMVGCSGKTLTALVYVEYGIFKSHNAQPADFSGYMGTDRKSVV